MSNKQRMFYLSGDSLTLREVKWFRLKFTSLALAAVMLGLAVILIFNHLLNDFLGLGYNRIELLSTENRILKEQLNRLTETTHALEATLNKLAEQDNQLRLIVDLPKIDPDVREVGTGGVEDNVDFGLYSKEAGQILQSSNHFVEKLEREVKLQEKSYEEINKKYEFNKVFFRHLPAIKPMVGFYAVNGFGNRLHPVLGVEKLHAGLDIINDDGTLVYASGDGEVTFSGRTGGGYGIGIVINHGYGYQTMYAHLSKAIVKEGKKVKRGDLIAYSGRSGLVSGPHLHYEVRFKGVRHNPVDYFFDDINFVKVKQQTADE